MLTKGGDVAVLRYTLKCDYCEKTTLLRLGVGHEERQPFYFECENCSQSIQGALILNKEGDEIAKFEVTGATPIQGVKPKDIFEKTTDFAFTFDPDFAYSDESAHDGVLTPFLQAMHRHKDDFIPRLERMALFDMVLKEGVPDLNRIIRNYKAEKWDLFAKGVKQYIPGDWPVDLPIDKNRALYQIIEFFLSPVVTSRSHADLILSFTKYTATIVSDKPNEFDSFILKAENLGYLQSIQYDALDLVTRFFNLANEFRPVVMEWHFENPDSDFRSGVKIKGRIKFHDVKSFYVDCYELACRSLTLVTGLINIMHRSNCDAYIPHPRLVNKFFSSNIEDFHTRSHAPKIEILAEEPLFYDWLEKALDSKLRNAVGHNSLSYDKSKEEITYVIDKKGKKATISYGDFLTKTLRLFIRTHQTNHLIKLLYVHKYLPRSGS